MNSQQATVTITASEVNDKHGTGIYLKRIFKDDRNIISIRSSDDYAGEQSFGYLSFRFNHHQSKASELIKKLGGVTVSRILCVPYTADDVLTAIVLKNHFQAQLCTYLMDDQNIFAAGISDQLMANLLKISELRLTISPEMRDLYSKKYGISLTFMPPLVAPELYQQPSLENQQLQRQNTQAEIGVLIGNIWGKQAFRLLYQTVAQTNHEIHWYGQGNAEALVRVSYGTNTRKVTNIKTFGFLPTEEDLITTLSQYPFAIIATGNLDAGDDRPEISQLSIPSRIPFIVATTQTPLIVLGSPRTAAARFVTRFGLGLVCPYDVDQFNQAVAQICQPEVQKEIRQNAMNIAPAFDVSGFADWLWQSLEAGQPLKSRYDIFADQSHFEELLPSLFYYARANITEELNLDEKILDTPTLKLLRWLWLWTSLKVKVKTLQIWRLVTLQKIRKNQQKRQRR